MIIRFSELANVCYLGIFETDTDESDKKIETHNHKIGRYNKNSKE